MLFYTSVQTIPKLKNHRDAMQDQADPNYPQNLLASGFEWIGPNQERNSLSNGPRTK
jgi:1,4-alpha-glucan branching enzyme